MALGAALLWGICRIVLSPCHLASLPLIVGFIDEQGQTSTRHAFWLSTLFATGILVTIGVIGAVTAALGHLLGQVGPAPTYFVAAVFLVVGLHLLGVIPLPLPGAATPGLRRKGLLAALILGLIFGLALGPCTFAYMAPMLAVTFRVARDEPAVRRRAAAGPTASDIVRSSSPPGPPRNWCSAISTGPRLAGGGAAQGRSAGCW